DLVREHQIDVILPLATFELLDLSKNKTAFEKINCKVCVSEFDSLLKANDRHLLYQEFRDFDFVPGFFHFDKTENLEKLAEKLGYPNEKVVMKPFISHGTIGLRIID